MSLPPLPAVGATTKAENYDKITAWANAVGALALNALPIKGDLGTANLDAVTVPAIYFQTDSVKTTLALNYPLAGVVGTLEVLPYRGAAEDVLQRFTVASGLSVGGVGGIYQRRYLTTWSPWKFIPTHRTSKDVGRAIYVWDEVHNREQRIYGDTGWRDITELANVDVLTSGSLRVKRTQDCLIVRFTGGTTIATADAVILTLPDGYFPDSACRMPIAMGSNTAHVRFTGAGATLRVDRAGTFSETSEVRIDTTRVWPTTAPGAPVGAIPNL